MLHLVIIREGNSVFGPTKKLVRLNLIDQETHDFGVLMLTHKIGY